MRTVLEDRIRGLWDKVCRLKRNPTKVYADRKYQFDSDEEAILTILCWGPWTVQSQTALISKVQERFAKLGKALDSCSPEELRSLVDSYRFPWQKAALGALMTHLQRRRLALSTFRDQLCGVPPLVARGELQIALGMSSDKIVDCLMRDWLLLDAFPIDSRVERVLERHGVPATPPTIVAACTRLDIPVRVFARAVYALADDLDRPSKRSS